ncbi:hypothetical protein ACUY3M_03855 [Corynebacterium suicordis]
MFKQALAGALLTLCVTIGATMSWFGARAWTVMLVTAVISSLTAMTAARFVLTPPGSVFFIFATAAVVRSTAGRIPSLLSGSRRLRRR